MNRPRRRVAAPSMERLEARQMLRGGAAELSGLLSAAAARGLVAARATPSTVLVGRVVDAWGVGVAGATVTVVDGGGRFAAAARADARGRFVLRGVDGSDASLILAAESTGPASGRYASVAGPLSRYAAGLHAASAAPGSSLTVALPTIDAANAVDFRRVARGAAVDVTTPALPGFALHVAPGSAAGAAGGAYRGRIAATPSAGPDGSLAVAVDGPGLRFRTPAKVTLPNATGAAPGATFPLVVVGPRGRVATMGVLRVSADGHSLETASGGLLGPGVVIAPRAASATSVAVPSEPSRIAATGDGPRSVETAEAVALSVAVGSTLEASIVPGGLVGPAARYTITPQPLPAGMTFDLGTGALTFVPAPGQAGTYEFRVVASDGARTVVQAVSIRVAQPLLESTVVSGRVVDESGEALAGLPVQLGDGSAVTDEDGRFSIVGVPADPGPIRVGGAVARAQDRLALSAPAPDLLGHPLYDRAENVFPDDLVVPRVAWSDPSSSAAKLVDDRGASISTAAMPGLEIRIADPDAAKGLADSPVTISAAELVPSLAAQHLARGTGGKMIVVRTSGLAADQQVGLTLPNVWGYAPGDVLSLMKFNPATGGREPVAEVVVSKDGGTVVATGTVTLGTAQAEAAAVRSSGGVRPMNAIPPVVYLEACLIVIPLPWVPQSNDECHGCEPGGDEVAGTGVTPNADAQNRGNAAFASDVGLISGAFYEDHQTPTYYSQGAYRGVNLEYSSLQAEPKPVVQYQFTTSYGGASASITSITAVVSLGGVIQGAPVTYATPGGLVSGKTYHIPMQVDATSLATGVYPYTMTVTQNFGSSASIDVVASGYVNVVDEAAGALGAGWSVGGLQKIAQAGSGQVVVTAGRRGTQRFNPVYNNGQAYFQDLALATGPSTSKVLKNDGTAGFDAPAASSGVVAGVAAGDFDGDGKPDQVVATASALGVLLNDGAGGFTAGSTFSTPSGYVGRAVAVGDFTGDGVLDVAVLRAPTSGTGGYVVAVYTGTGAGTFSGPATSSVGNGGTATGGADSIAVGDFNADGKADLVFTTASGVIDVMIASTGGAMTSAGALPLASGHEAIGVATVDYNSDGKLDLVVETSAYVAGVYEAVAFLSVFAGTGSGGGPFTATTSTPYMTTGHTIRGIIGLVAGNFRGAAAGLEVAVPVHGDEPGMQTEYIALVPLSSSGVLGQQTLYPVGNAKSPAPLGNAAAGNIVAADLNGVQGRLSIAFTDGTGYVRILSPNPDTNQFFPVQNIQVSSTIDDVGKLAAAPFAGTAASPTYRGPASMPSTLVQNVGGTWTRTYPDGTVLQFDSSGRQVSTTDRNLNATAYAYVAAGQPGAGSLRTITDPVGLKTTFSYDGSGKLATILDPANRRTTVTIDGNGNLTQIVDPDLSVVQYGYSTPSNHRITTEVSPRGKTATVTYNAFGQATGEVLFGGSATSTAVPSRSRGLVAAGGSGTLATTYEGSVTDPNGRTTTLGYTWMGHPDASKDATGASTSTRYNRRGFPVVVSDALQRVTTYTYDSRGNVTSITRPEYVGSGGWGSGGWGSGGWGSGGVPSTMTIAYDDQYSVPTSVTDFLGRTTTFTLDSRGNVLRRTDPDGLYEEWTYNSAGLVLTNTDRIGAVTTYQYDAYGRVNRVYNPSGTASFLQDATFAGTATAGSAPIGGQGPSQAFDGSLATKWVSIGASWLQYQFYGGASYTVVQYSLTSGEDNSFYPGRAPKDWLLQGSNDGSTWTTVDSRTGQSDPLNLHTTTYAVASPGSYKYYRLNVTANNGNTYTQLMEVKLTASVSTPVAATASYASFTYSSAGYLATATDEIGKVWRYTYDAMGRLKTVQDPVQVSVKTTYDYDASGNLAKVTDALGHVTSYAYDDRDRLISMTEPVHQGTGKSTTFVYDGMNLIAVVDPLGHATSYAYDGVNRLTSVKDALSNATTYVYDIAGQLKRVIDPLGHETRYDYDPKGRLKSVSEPSNLGTGYVAVARYEYDANDDVTRVVDAFNNAVVYAYDVLGRPISVKDALNHVTTYMYDPTGRTVAVVDPLGRAAISAYDVRGRLVSEKAPVGGGATTYSYDLASHLTSLTDPVGNTTTWTYDGAGRVLTEVDPLGKTTTYMYDVVGNLTRKTDRRILNFVYAYDANDRLVTEKWVPYPWGASVNIVTYTYDDAGRLAQIQDGKSKYAYGYDAADRLVTVDDQGTTGLPQVTLTYDYDAAGNRTGVADTKGGLTTYAYNGRDQLTRITQSGTGVAAKRVDYSYDDMGRTTGLVRYADLAGTSKVVATSYAYDADHRLTSIVHKDSGGTTRASYVYTLDAVDRLTSETRTWNSGASTDVLGYGYTDDGQLTSVSHSNGSFANETFGYDANGNRNTSGYTTGTGNRISSDGVYNYAYDDEGNQVSKTEIATGNQTLYKWDHRNRLIEVDSKVGAVTTVLATYTYDALDRRIGEKAGTTVRWTLYDGYSPILDFNAAGTQTARYLQAGPDVVDQVLARETASGVAWYLADRLGTVRDLVDNSGTVIDHVDYNAYGAVVGESAPAVGDRLAGYAGMERDATAGLASAVKRTYDTSTGRWLSNDPIGYSGGDSNLTRYSLNDPVNRIDPSGLFQEPASGVIPGGALSVRPSPLRGPWAKPDRDALDTQLENMKDVIRKRLKEIEELRKEINDCGGSNLNFEMDELRDILNRMLEMLNNPGVRPTYTHSSIPGKDADSGQYNRLTGGIWLNDYYSWQYDPQVLFHEFSHPAGAVDFYWPFDSVKQPHRDGACIGQLANNPLKKTDIGRDWWKRRPY